MTQTSKDTTVKSAIEILAEQGFNGLPEALSTLFNQAMLVEHSKHLNASPYERTSERSGRVYAQKRL